MTSCSIQVDKFVLQLAEQTLARIISKQLDFLQNGEGAIEMQILQNLYVGILTGDKDLLQAFQLLYCGRKRTAKGKSTKEAQLLKWACSTQMKDFLLAFITNQRQKREPFRVVDQMVMVRGETVNAAQMQIGDKEEEAPPQNREEASPRPTVAYELQPCESEESSFEILHLREPSLPHINQQLMIYNDRNLMEQVIQLPKNKQIATMPEPKRVFDIASQFAQVQQDRLLLPKENEIKPTTVGCQQILREHTDQFNLSHSSLNSFQSSQKYGHFLFGDQIQEIIKYRLVQKNLHFQIKWKTRSDGTQPQNCFLQSATLKQHCPYQLIKIYEQLVK